VPRLFYCIGATFAALLPAPWYEVAAQAPNQPVAGDVTGDRLVQADDVQLTVNGALGVVPPDRAQPDIDFDGDVDASDVQLVVNAALGINIDPDGDGLATAAEDFILTDPLEPDTDGDGVSDGEEIVLGTNPLDGINPGEERNVTVDGRRRTYSLYIGSSAPVQSGSPLVVCLHGIEQTTGDIRFVTGFDSLANQRGFVVAYPAAFEGTWNDGRGVDGVPAYDENVDDVAFVAAVVEDVARRVNINPSRVYIAGYSNGGLMAQRIAIEDAARYAAFASVSGSIAASLFVPAPPDPMPIPAILVNGTADSILPFEGLNDPEGLGVVLAVPDTVGYWLNANGTATLPDVVELPNRELPLLDRSSVTLFSYAAGANAAPVRFYQVNNGGHGWPGSPASQGFFLGELINQDIDASEHIIDFFAAYTR